VQANRPVLSPLSARDARHLSDVALAAARAGAAVIAERTRDRASLTWEEKSPADFVSVVDRAAEAALADVVATRLPEATLLAEEGTPDAALTHGVVVVADPLDGTTNFLHGFPWYATSVGVLVDDMLTAGAVVNAATGETFVAARGHGAVRVHADGSTVPLAVSSIAAPLRALIGTGFPFRHAHHLPRYQAQFAAIATRTAGMRRAGSAALDLCDVACGRFEGFWEIELAPWDVAAGVLLVREAGGMVTDWDGVDVPVRQGPIVASNGPLHGWLLDALAGRLG
jgi:myo-inositol-1(or 4)-monophosphatase